MDLNGIVLVVKNEFTEQKLVLHLQRELLLNFRRSMKIFTKILMPEHVNPVENCIQEKESHRRVGLSYNNFKDWLDVRMDNLKKCPYLPH